MFLRPVIYVVASAAVFAACKHWGIAYTYADYKSYLDMLISVSGMVFTLMGIWIAVLYPNALSRLVDPNKISTPDFSESLLETKRLEAIVASVLQSGVVVVLALGIALARLVLLKSQIYADHIVNAKLGALAVVVTLSIVQAEAILAVLIANVMFLYDLHKRREQREVDADI